jgi:phosphomevalonate kinase
MTVSASAPGKVVLLGEYVVLDGGSALVMAVDRRCRAELSQASGDRCRLTMLMPDAVTAEFAAGEPTGSALVDTLKSVADLGPPWPVWSGLVDSSDFFSNGLKLGLGSSAAVLVAFAGAAWKAAGKSGQPGLSALIHCHREFQGGSGSGIDVAAAWSGGVVEFRLDNASEGQIGSVQLPKSVGFAGIFAGGSASTPGLVGRYRQWADSGSAPAIALRKRLIAVAEGGCAAVNEDDGIAFVAAIDEYGRCLQALGQAVGVDLVTAAHRQIGALAGKMGLAYKVSGAGGGDVGIACGLDEDALRAFCDLASNSGFHIVPLNVDEQGLRVEEHAA